jgi:peptide/nickel transport system permease protein
MGQYFARRALQAIPLLFVISIMVFILIKNAGDPLSHLANQPDITAEDRAYVRRSLGLDDPIHTQYIHWLLGDTWDKYDMSLDEHGALDNDGIGDTPGTQKGILRGDFGTSIAHNRPVLEVFKEFLPNTLLLGISALSVTIFFGITIGMYAALHQYSWIDNIITTLCFITYSMPIFLVALLGVYVFAVLFREWGLPYLPVQHMSNQRAASKEILDVLWHLILPTMSIALISIARYVRFMRASMLEVISSDYVRTARSKGLGERRITIMHMFRNASLPVITLISLDIPFILSGAIVTETIFSWPGMGKLFVRSLEPIDPPIIMIFVLMTSVAVVISQFMADIVYAMADPRIRYD